MYFSIGKFETFSTGSIFGPADFPHSNFDTISVILLAETAMFQSCFSCNISCKIWVTIFGIQYFIKKFFPIICYTVLPCVMPSITLACTLLHAFILCAAFHKTINIIIIQITSQRVCSSS